MNILAFDTSSKTASVAILHEDEILYDKLINTGKNHSEVLLPAIDEALQETRLKASQMDLLVCTLGPGSFTGLRIGVSTLKGLMMGIAKPAAGVSSLEALALNVGPTDKTIGAMLDAGRGQVYLAYFRYDHHGDLTPLTAEKVLAPNQIEELDGPGVIYVGDGAVKYADVLRTILSEKNQIASDEHQHIRASSVALLGLKKLKSRDLLNLDGCVPLYLRSADALPAASVLLPRKA